MFGSTASRYWSTNTVGVRALASLGFSVEFVEVVSDDSEPTPTLLLRSADSEDASGSEE